MALNNNQAFEVLQKATQQFSGETPLESLSLQGIIDTATTWNDVQRNQWASELISAQVNNVYTDTSYQDNSNDVFYENSEAFGAITQVISIEMPEVIESRNWVNVTSGTTTIGSNVVYLPVVDADIYVGTASWSVPIAFTGTQLNAAFQNASGLLTFNNYVRLAAENSVKYHKQVMATMNRNNYIAEKLNTGNSAGKINVVNLVEEYAKYTGATSMTAQAYLSNTEALRYASRVFYKYKALLLDMSTLFTQKTSTHGKFVAYDRLVFQVLSDFEGLMNVQVMSDIFHNEFVRMPLYRNVSRWQAQQGESASADFDTLSSIDVVTADGNAVSQSGIVGFMCDKWAIMHTIVQNRVGVQRDDIKDITLNDYQFTDRYINNLNLPGVVFVVQDYTAA